VKLGMIGQHLQLLSRTLRLFFETSSGSRLSIEICMWSSPAGSALNPLDIQQVPIRDHPGNRAVLRIRR